MHTPQTPYVRMSMTRCWRNESSQNNLFISSQPFIICVDGHLVVCVQFFRWKSAISMLGSNHSPLPYRKIAFTHAATHPGSVHRLEDNYFNSHIVLSIRRFVAQAFMVFQRKDSSLHFRVFSVCWRILPSLWMCRHLPLWMHVCVWIEYLFSFEQSRMFVFNVVCILVVIETHRVMHAGCNFIVRTQYLNGRS